MFGYIIPNKPELRVKEYNRYRAWYCGLCHCLKESYGVIGEVTLTYDMTFLIMLLNSLYEPLENVYQSRCAVHPVRKHMEVTSECSKYGADMNLILAYYKLMDDFQDDKSRISQTAAIMMQKHIQKLKTAYPRQVQAIQKELRFLAKLEAEKRRDPAAAARSFGRLLGEVFVWREDLWAKDLYKIGYYLGIYIYLIDAWKDFPEDRRQASYNPLPYEKQSDAEEKQIRKIMLQAMTHCAGHMEKLPLIRDIEILRNIVYSGVWMAWNEKQKKGCWKHGERSV